MGVERVEGVERLEVVEGVVLVVGVIGVVEGVRLKIVERRIGVLGVSQNAYQLRYVVLHFETLAVLP